LAGVAEARKLAASATNHDKVGGKDSGKASATVSGTVSGTVTLSASLRSKVSAEDTVFIFARPAEGSRMPLAILRKQVKDLPIQFTLDDSMGMGQGPNQGLAQAQQVVVGARVSKSGQAMPRAGDLEGFSAPVRVGQSGIQIEISTVK
jgi:cytochrome c-type biogenesis protein CcmH